MALFSARPRSIEYIEQPPSRLPRQTFRNVKHGRAVFHRHSESEVQISRRMSQMPLYAIECIFLAMQWFSLAFSYSPARCSKDEPVNLQKTDKNAPFEDILPIDWSPLQKLRRRTSGNAE